MIAHCERGLRASRSIPPRDNDSRKYDLVTIITETLNVPAIAAARLEL